MRKSSGNNLINKESTTQFRFKKTCEVFCNRLKKNFPQIYKKFSELSLQSKNGVQQKEQLKIQQRLDYLSETVQIFQGNNDIIQELNKLLHRDAQIQQMKKDEDEIQEQYMQCQKLINEKNPSNSELFSKTFQEIKNSYQKNPLDQLLKKCKKFIIDPLILEEIYKIIPQNEENQDYSEKHFSINFKNQQNLHVINNNSIHSNYIKPTNKRRYQYSAYNQLNNNINNNNNNNLPLNQTYLNNNSNNLFDSNYSNSLPIVNNSNIILTNNTNFNQIYYPAGLRTDAILLNNIENSIGQLNYRQFLKVLFLYSESIISYTEFFDLIGAIFEKFPSFNEKFIDFIQSRQYSRKKINQLFKPLSDMDFQKAERKTHSYVDMPIFYPKFCSNSSQLTKSVLNDEIISIPLGSEHTSFQIYRKNQWEDALFKSEDEKYEFDHYIQNFKKIITILEKLIKCSRGGDINNDINHKNYYNKIQIKLINQFKDFKHFVSLLYKEQSDEVMNHLLQEKNGFQLILDNVKDKYKEILEICDQKYKKQWHEISQKNFYRSLDHRSFYFKKLDRKYTAGSKFEKEPEFRMKVLKEQVSKNKPEQLQKEEGLQMIDMKKYFKFLNTFDGLTNKEKCEHSHEEKIIKFDLDKLKEKEKLPFMILSFENQQVCQDTFSLLYYYIQNYAVANYAEKNKMKQIMKCSLEGFFGFKIQLLSIDEALINESRLISICEKINNKIFEQTFAIFFPDSTNNQQKDDDENEENAKLNKNELNSGEENQLNNFSDDEKISDEEEEENKSQIGTKNNQIKKNIKRNNENSVKNDSNSNKGEDPLEKWEELQNNNNKINNNNQLIDDNDDDQFDLEELLNSTDEEDGIKEMNYKQDFTAFDDSIYLPNFRENNLIFYGTKYFYIFIRFFYTLYERMLKAKEFSFNIEQNLKTKLMSEEEKQQLQIERYETFKQILLFSLKNRDSVKYEDFIRSLFGERSFLLSTIDKVLTSTSKSLHNFINDELSKQMLEKYIQIKTKTNEIFQKKLLNKPDQIQFAKANRMAFESKQQQDKHLFRFFYDQQYQILYINYFNTIYNQWEKDQIEKVSQYFENYLIKQTIPFNKQNKPSQNHIKKVFLNRNKRKILEKQKQLSQSKQIQQYFQVNNIEYYSEVGSNKLISCQKSSEDQLISKQKLLRKAVPIQQIIFRETKKICQFKIWLDEIQNLQFDKNINKIN